MLGIHPIQSEIEKRKLYFLEKLCKMETNLLPKQVFTARLFEYLNNIQNTKFGYIKDISLIIRKYSLQNFMDRYIRTGNFPSNFFWKNIVEQTVNSFDSTEWREKNEHGFRLYRCYSFVISSIVAYHEHVPDDQVT